MKHILITFSLLILCTQQITFSMEGYEKVDISMDEYWDKEDPQTEELQPIYRDQRTINQALPTKNPSFNEEKTIDLINAAINKKYDANPTLFSIFSPAPQLTEENFFDIIHIISTYSPTPRIDLINKLSKKNKLCNQAITYFDDLARKNIDTVTIETLETIQDPSFLQPITQLNKLPALIKALFMTNAYNAIKHSCDIVLTGHTDIINFFDICTATHSVATSSKDKTLRLWDLKTGKLIHIFPGDNNRIDCMRFTADGSCLATATNYTDDTSTITIWETQSAQLLCDTAINRNITALSYGTNNTLIAYDTNQWLPHITILSINKDSINVLTSFVESQLKAPSFKQESLYWNNLYKTRNPYKKPNNLRATLTDATLTVTKRNCRPLYLCEQAIKNIQTQSHPSICKTLLFQILTAYEKKEIHYKEYSKDLDVTFECTFLKHIEKNKLLTNK